MQEGAGAETGPSSAGWVGSAPAGAVPSSWKACRMWEAESIFNVLMISDRAPKPQLPIKLCYSYNCVL